MTINLPTKTLSKLSDSLLSSFQTTTFKIPVQYYQPSSPNKIRIPDPSLWGVQTHHYQPSNPHTINPLSRPLSSFQTYVYKISRPTTKMFNNVNFTDLKLYREFSKVRMLNLGSWEREREKKVRTLPPLKSENSNSQTKFSTLVQTPHPPKKDKFWFSRWFLTYFFWLWREGAGGLGCKTENRTAKNLFFTVFCKKIGNSRTKNSECWKLFRFSNFGIIYCILTIKIYRKSEGLCYNYFNFWRIPLSHF